MIYEKPSVLIVDDEKMVCDLLTAELEDRGYSCATVYNGNKALSKLATQDFHVVLLDIRLPGISGIEVLKEIRTNYDDVATIMITAINDVYAAIEVMKLGAVDYIVKPFELERITTSINTALETKGALHRAPTEMDAIAFGVEAGQNLFDSHSKIVTQATIDIARRIDIADKEIQSWAAARAKLDSERERVIKSAMNKFERNPLAQKLMGMTDLHRFKINPDESQN